MQRTTKIALILGTAILATSHSTYAQSTSEIMRISNQNYGIGTARSAAMGGAFTSLGADPISMSLNPAGIAMYKSGEVSASPSVRIANSISTYSGPGGSVTQSRDRTRFNLGNAAVVYSNGKFAVGFGMNRLADFNRRTYTEGYKENVSIGQMFAEQLFGINQDQLKSGNDPYRSFVNFPPSMWGAILGYRTGMVDPTSSGNTYNTADIFNYQYGDLQRPGREITTTGGIYEYNISAGGNINDFIYVGGTLGVQDIYHTSSEMYTELADLDNSGGLDNMTYRQNYRFHGTGVNLKLGVTVRPTDWLRIGLSYHTPTWIGAIMEYDADMTVYDKRYMHPGGGMQEAFSQSAIYANEYDMRTPSRLMAGASATIGGIAIISADYERTWYGSMKYTSPGYDFVNNQIKEYCKTRNTFRFGAEVQPISQFFVRAGYNVYFDQGENLAQYKGFEKLTHMQFSGGLGYRNKLFSLDLAYVYYSSREAPYRLFSYTASDGYTVEPTGIVYDSHKNHNIIMTLAFRF